MAGAQNRVVEGFHKGMKIMIDCGHLFIIQSGNALLGARGFPVTKQEIDGYELITEDKVRSGTSVILRGAAGAALLGPIGLLAGVTGKKKGVFCVALQWKNGQKSLIEIDDKLYKVLVSSMF